MRNWLTSLNGAVFFSALALLTFIGRGLLDWRYEYSVQDPEGQFDTIGVLVYMALVGGWVWAIVSASHGRRRGLMACLTFALVLNVLLALATFFIFCPSWTDCEGWPNAWLWNWSNLITGALAAVAASLQIWGRGRVGRL